MKDYFTDVKWNSWKNPSSKLHFFNSLLTGTLDRKANAHLVCKSGSCPSGMEFIELRFANFFSSHQHYLIDVTHIWVTMAHHSTDSGGGEVFLDRTSQNRGQVRVWKGPPRDQHLCRRQRAIVTAISKNSPRMESSFHRWQSHLMLIILPKAPIIWYIESHAFLSSYILALYGVTDKTLPNF